MTSKAITIEVTNDEYDDILKALMMLHARRELSFQIAKSQEGAAAEAKANAFQTGIDRVAGLVRKIAVASP